MWLTTGPPKFADIVRRYASMAGWIECAWDDSESVWHEYDDGRFELYRAVWRLTGRCTFEGATEAEALALASDLQGVFNVVPRTRADGDPDSAEEHVVQCRRRSPLPATAQLARRDARTGRPVWSVPVEFEGVSTYDTIPGTVTGGFSLIEERTPPGWAQLATYGDATQTLQTYTVSIVDPATGQTVQGQRAYVELGPPALAAARTERVSPTSLRINTRD